MRGNPAEYELVNASSLTEALQLVAAGHKPFAGGTDLMVLFESGKLPPAKFVSLQGLTELSGITIDSQHITLGALTTYTQVRNHPVLSVEHPNLANAARETGAIAIQNRGTLGGNIANASPAADSPPALLVAGAEVEVRSVSGARWLAYDGFHTGYKKTQMRADELVTRVRVPRGESDESHFYRKVGTRKAQAISKVCVAASARVTEGKLLDLRIALGSVGPIPLRAKHTEAALSGRVITAQMIADARNAMLKDIAPIDDIRSTRDYRLCVAQNLVEDLAKRFAAS